MKMALLLEEQNINLLSTKCNVTKNHPFVSFVREQWALRNECYLPK
jgi:hypothetical protein